MSTKIGWTTETKTCSRCGESKPLSAFNRDRSRPDGRTYWCRGCRSQRRTELFVSGSTGAPFGPKPLPERDGDARQARRTVNHLVETGRFAHPNDVPCTDCGHMWESGQRRHEYDHHRGYGTGHHRDVEAVCTTCHHRREQKRRAS